MKITLDQTEIETAVRNYVNEQVSVKEGQRIDIDFTAGRGANGLTATVDIVSNGTAKAAAPKTAPATDTTAKPEAAAPNQEAAVTPVAETTVDPVADAGDDAGLDEANGEVQEVKPTNSIFSGLTRPKND